MTTRNTKPGAPKAPVAPKGAVGAPKAPVAPATYWLVSGEVVEAPTMPPGAVMRHNGTDWVSLAPKGATAPKGTVPAVTDHAAKVAAAAKTAGGTVVRLGKSGVTPKGFSKAWIDFRIGSLRIQGNAFVMPEKSE